MLFAIVLYINFYKFVYFCKDNFILIFKKYRCFDHLKANFQQSTDQFFEILFDYW